MPNPISKRGDSERIVVAGAGLVGALAALLLAQRGKRVVVVERRSDPLKHGWAGGRSINLAISTRGLTALSRVGLREKALAEAVRMPGRQIHPVGGGEVFQAYGTQAHHCIHSISRGRLNEIILQRLSTFSTVEIFYDTAVENLDVEGDFLLGCDGGGSAVRRRLVEKGEITSTEEILDYGYKELSIPAAPGGKWQMTKEALHIWPRGKFMLIALPNLDGSYTLTLFLPYEGAESFATLKSDEQISSFFKRHFPDVAALIPDPVAEFKGNPTGQMGTVRCNQWDSPGLRTLLLGDAAHAIVPFFGQGMNCGFEDCAFLDELLEKGGDWTAIAHEVSKVRKPNSDAIATMALENFVEMRDFVGDPKFLLQKEVEKKLEKTFPGRYRSRYEMVSFSRIPYRVAYEAGEKQKQLLAKLCESIKSVDDVDKNTAKSLIETNLKDYFTYWEDQNGSWN
jgi:kynurenine 3-monooxygenase